ncbi:hypothetical protein [Fluviispira sanaruensis]|uniref:C2H2-type domain-containing protein n=1 Tax=Fluviispira sanaruensis TaxID=2493639 RepID=A0A4P2VKQ7_FLUSA|nr:hypothetical protein [Fluviispira sanaruensis]BBH53371.1 hypothetical protein JCM31447_18140 [Fluviispira sanaruensis]
MVVDNVQLLLKPKKKTSSPTMQRVCRVFKGPACYICGLCGRRYKNLKDAWKCVTINGLKIKSHLIADSNSFAHNYQCLLCGKIYANQQDTSLCVIRDVEAGWFPRVLAEHLLNMAHSMLNADPKTRRNLLITRQRGGGAPIPESDEEKQAPKKQAQLNDTMNDSMDDDENNMSSAAPAQNESNESTEVQAQTPKLESVADSAEGATGEPMDHEEVVYYEKAPEKDKPVLFRTPGQKPFIRNGSNYVCSVCNEKFFTKMEAETHFNEHPLVETV